VLGCSVGKWLGRGVGKWLGTGLGTWEGSVVGLNEGFDVGNVVGFDVGKCDGEGVGCSEGTEKQEKSRTKSPSSAVASEPSKCTQYVPGSLISYSNTLQKKSLDWLRRMEVVGLLGQSLRSVSLVSILVSGEHVVRCTNAGSRAKIKKCTSPEGFPAKFPLCSFVPDTTESHAKYSNAQASDVG